MTPRPGEILAAVALMGKRPTPSIGFGCDITTGMMDRLIEMGLASGPRYALRLTEEGLALARELEEKC